MDSADRVEWDGIWESRGCDCECCLSSLSMGGKEGSDVLQA
jgi:hypothetical protein